jgi:mono/diheme cytochrome c family protein
MMRGASCILALLAGVGILAGGPSLRAAEPAPEGKQAEQATAAQVRALFAAKCLACHGNDVKDLKGKFDLRSRAAALKGGESGAAAIVPGQPDKSPLVRAITWEDATFKMPPKENDRLTSAEVSGEREDRRCLVEWTGRHPHRHQRRAFAGVGQPHVRAGRGVGVSANSRCKERRPWRSANRQHGPRSAKPDRCLPARSTAR